MRVEVGSNQGGLGGGVGYGTDAVQTCRMLALSNAIRGRMLNPGSAALGTKILGSDTSLTLGRQGCDPRSLSCFTLRSAKQKVNILEMKEIRFRIF